MMSILLQEVKEKKVKYFFKKVYKEVWEIVKKLFTEAPVNDTCGDILREVELTSACFRRICSSVSMSETLSWSLNRRIIE